MDFGGRVAEVIARKSERIEELLRICEEKDAEIERLREDLEHTREVLEGLPEWQEYLRRADAIKKELDAIVDADVDTAKS